MVEVDVITEEMDKNEKRNRAKWNQNTTKSEEDKIGVMESMSE